MTLDVELESTPAAPARARSALEEVASSVSSERMRDLRLLVSELVTNSLRHADLGPEDAITLTVTVDEGTIRVEVSDPGPGFEFAGRADDPETVEGWGLYLVATLADRWAVERNVVWFELDRAPSLDAAA